MFYKAFKLYGTGLEFKSHCIFSTLPLWPSIHFFHHISGQATCCCLLCLQISASHVLSIFSFFAESIYFQGQKNIAEVEICLYISTHGKQIFFIWRSLSFMFSAGSRTELSGLMLWTLKGEISSGRCLDEWSGKKTSCTLFTYTK